VKRYLIPLGAFALGTTLIAGLYFGIMIWAENWDVAASQFVYNRWYIVPLWLGFGVQAALYSILRLRLFAQTSSSGHAAAMTPFTGVMGTSGGTSATAMVACCLHHVTDVLPILGLSAAATFLTRYQRPFMLVGLGMNLIGILVMLRVLYRERQKFPPLQDFKPVLETK
jgi:hypothetical protein